MKSQLNQLFVSSSAVENPIKIYFDFNNTRFDIFNKFLKINYIATKLDRTHVTRNSLFKIQHLAFSI
ncbi:hypothetical protein IMCC3317_36370 [Kordia antarctica]|uniref:Uncharacterized protein n=1 Tax=Kordia antarctica TaxID=1218801 RepID=A0A7L4ZNE0_9FLAO|nr:hypothetical protein IMCC3317_36370 [Kordia antarctica]